MSFKAVFFRIYDRKIGSGEITFNATGINKNDFTRLCVEPYFVFNNKTMELIRETMKLTDAEAEELAAARAETESEGEAALEAAWDAEHGEK
jgi:hypothetical protein